VKIGIRRMALMSSLPPLLLAGCATQGGAGTEPIMAEAKVPASAATTPPPAAANHAAHSAPQLQPPNAMESESGIQITRVGLTASGGLVDVRFRVLDPAKARALLGNPANPPMLLANDNPPVMPPHHALKGARFAKDQVFYILYPNVRGAVQAGAPVMVAVGPVRLGPVTAQ
jgi:hypothetical protein